MRIVKTDWRNSLLKKNLTSLCELLLAPLYNCLLPNIEIKLLATGIMTKIAASIKNNVKSIGKEKPQKKFELPPLFETSSESKFSEDEEESSIS